MSLKEPIPTSEDRAFEPGEPLLIAIRKAIQDVYGDMEFVAVADSAAKIREKRWRDDKTAVLALQTDAGSLQDELEKAGETYILPELEIFTGTHVQDGIIDEKNYYWARDRLQVASTKLSTNTEPLPHVQQEAFGAGLYIASADEYMNFLDLLKSHDVTKEF